MTIYEQIKGIGEEAVHAIRESGSLTELEAVRIKYLGKKGGLTSVLKQMGTLTPEERPAAGQLANEAREAIENAISERHEQLKTEQLEQRMRNEKLDVTIPGTPLRLGRKHPLSIVWDEVVDIFIGMGFTAHEGPEIELSDYCFTRLNTPYGHPARDRQDTFYLDEDETVCLRTQTSSVQIRVMEKTQPPIRIISPGRVYRKDEVDATHSPMFHQIEGLVVDKGITMGNLKATLNAMLRGLYGPEIQTRFRPHHFPYTEPSCEVDIQCFECGGKGCRVCKQEGWIELLGAGMVHHEVLRGCGIDPEIYSGFAFGVGIDRLTLGRFNILDLRLLFENDVRFLSQF